MADKDVSFKNLLQEYTQKHGKQSPSYLTFNEGQGFQHDSNFRSVVVADGTVYKSKSSHSTRKQAEQEVAKIAYEDIQKKFDDKEFSLLYKEPTLCISILREFAMKKKMIDPIYHIDSYVVGQGSVYICNLVFEGKTYKGEFGTKKMAKQLAARATILSLLETDAGTLSEIIMSKNKYNPGIQTKMVTDSTEKMLPNCSDNDFQGQNFPSTERDIIGVNTDDSTESGIKRENENNNMGRNTEQS